MQPEKNPPGYWQPTAETQPYNPSPLEEVPGTAAPVPEHNADQPISWQASESVHEERQGIWFVGIIVVAVILVAVSLFLIKSITFAILVVVMAISLIILARRPPRVLNYQLGPHGLQIGEKQFSYHDFRAFGVLQDGPLLSVVMIPNKRFMPNVNIYFPPESGEHIVDVLGSVLPMEQVEPDVLDKVIRQLHL